MTVIVVQTKHDFWYTKDDSMVATTGLGILIEVAHANTFSM